jgi:hypothetical protein
MKIEIKEKGTEAFYRETVNVASQYKALIKRPDKKLSDRFAVFRIEGILCVVLFALTLLTSLAWGFDTLGIISMVLLAFVAFLCFCYLRNMKQLMKSLMDDPRSSVLTLDDLGVELDKEGTQTVRISWENVAFLRVFKECFAFLAKSPGGFMITVNMPYKEEVLQFLREHRTGVEIYENK